MTSQTLPSVRINVDFSPYLADLNNELLQLNQHEWVSHVNQNNYEGCWDVLPLRCKAEHVNAHPILQSFVVETNSEWQNLPLLKNNKMLSGILAQICCPIKSVRLMRLRPNAHIKPHRDKGLCFENGEVRLHIALQTDPNVHFMSHGQALAMNVGELWYLNADQIHSVHNNSDVDRIHLVIDCLVDDWLKQVIESRNL